MTEEPHIHQSAVAGVGSKGMSDDSRGCTCHPTDRPPICQHRYAARECQNAYRAYKAMRVTVSCLCGTQGCSAETCNPTAFKAATMSVENRHLRAALLKRDQEVAELERLAAMRLEEINEIKRTREQERDYADVCYHNEQLGKQLHAANNELTNMRGERDRLRSALEEIGDGANAWGYAVDAQAIARKALAEDTKP